MLHNLSKLKGTAEQKGIKEDQNLGMEKEENDESREAAIAATPCLQPSFNPKGLSKDRLSKFRVDFTIIPVFAA